MRLILFIVDELYMCTLLAANV